jgi:hypothetical protein
LVTLWVLNIRNILAIYSNQKLGLAQVSTGT